MARVRSVGGFQFSGAIGGVVFCRRAGGVYARAYVVPRDPKTPAQIDRRRDFGEAVAAWRQLPDADKEQWRRRAARSERTGYHLFLAEFRPRRARPDSKEG
jgi:hypothetical protein